MGWICTAEPRLPELLEQLEQIEGIEWIRLMYLYPMYFGDELIDVLAASKKIVPYLDIPLQHINDTMLRRMQRRVTKAETELLLDKLRARIPELGAAHDLHHWISGRDRRTIRRAGRFREQIPI